MRITYLFAIYLILLFNLPACQQQIEITKYATDQGDFLYMGRIDQSTPGEVILIGSASSVTANFSGNTCIIHLKNNTTNAAQNYVVLELDGEYLGRKRIAGDDPITLEVEVHAESENHELKIVKATEAANGTISFTGITCEKLNQAPSQKNVFIEFIGDSITCGMGVDDDQIACHTDQWYDQHNAYLAYGPRSARALNADYMLSSVSGIGMYRNWNGVGPIMPMVYSNTYLDIDSSNQWEFSNYQPDLISICLGTNDLSDGDGMQERLPFDLDLFSNNYIQFVSNVFTRYPKTKISLLTSPMVSGEKLKQLMLSLEMVKSHFDSVGHSDAIRIFEFKNVTPHGCDYHPDDDDQALMAEQLVPFYKNFLGI